MKKQFFRVKQLADQTFSRAGKTEALSDDLQDAEKRVEFIRSACLNIGKKLAVASVSHDSKDKRLKKNAEYLLGTFMLEITSAEEDHLLRQVVTHCGKLQTCLAKVIVDHEVEVENNIVTPLLNVCETDYPNIMKQKRALTKLILDMDSLKARFTASKHSGSAPNSKIKDELEEAESKVEQARETLACDMLQLISRETELSSIVLEYARLQKKYHEAAFKIVDQIIPEMEMAIKESRLGPVFGRPLEEHLEVTGRRIAFPIELCVCGLLESGTAEEGIFRVTPGASKMRRMKVSLDANCMDLETALQFKDPHIFAGVLKSYLRELPDPLLTHKLYDQWMEAARLFYTGNSKEGLQALWTVVHSLPPANLDNLHYLVKFLNNLASKQHTNRMTPQNLAIVIAPNLIWSPNEDPNIGLNMNTANLHSIIVESLVTHSNWLFPGEIDFYVTLSRDLGIYNGHGIEIPVESGMKRTQSNSSLSDHNSSPPHGSPKPALRRKQKPAAPNPPVNKEVKEEKNLDDKSKEKRREEWQELVKEHKGPPVKEEQPVACARETPAEGDQVATEKEEEKEEGGSKGDERSSLRKEVKVDPIEKPPMEIPMATERLSKSCIEGGGGGTLDRRTSKSGEDLRKGAKMQQEVYCTLERRRPPRPAPRTTLGSGGGEVEGKPAVPERPANLKRPLSSSFRIARSSDDPDQSPTDRESPGETGNVSLERTHIYNVEKQHVSFTNVPPPEKANSEQKLERERRESGEKPEKPKKPDSLVPQQGHQRAASEGSIIDTGMMGDGMRPLSRPPRPTPPPPPVNPVKKESTNL